MKEQSYVASHKLSNFCLSVRFSDNEEETIGEEETTGEGETVVSKGDLGEKETIGKEEYLGITEKSTPGYNNWEGIGGYNTLVISNGT